MKQFWIYLSSPDDVAADRAQARDLLLGLARDPFLGDSLRIAVGSWDDTDQYWRPAPAECDLTVVLLWGQMGEPRVLKGAEGTQYPSAIKGADGTPYPSATEWAFENARAANKPVLIYRRTEKILLDPTDPDFEEKFTEQRRVEVFFRHWEIVPGPLGPLGAYTYRSTEELLDLLGRDVASFLSKLLHETASSHLAGKLSPPATHAWSTAREYEEREGLPIGSLAPTQPQAVDPHVGTKEPKPRAGATTVFICYRREDSQDAAGRLHDRLVAAYGQDRVFMDIDSIPLGIDFVEHVSEQIARCSAVIVVIGKQWLKAKEGRRRRLDNDNDFVRAEIAVALQQKIPVIPVLIQDARMPTAADLPESISTLARRNGMELSASRWRTDVERLIKALDRVMNG